MDWLTTGGSEGGFPVRSPCLLSKEAMFFNPFALPVLSLSKEAYRRISFQSLPFDRLRANGLERYLERPFILRQAQHERK
ncbi:MAG: hypothetical protein LBD67_05580 [Candidatus Accumulibacter sp.]|nr:hypothetical protein [Accumulibacter sp.]